LVILQLQLFDKNQYIRGEKMEMVFCRGCAKEIHETAPSCPHCGYQQQVVANAGDIKSQSVAALLTAFLGDLGIHRFYLRRPITGVLYLLFCWTGIPGLLAFIETYIYTFTSQEKWAHKYNNGQISAPVHIGIKIIVLILPVLLSIVIVAGILMPSYEAYKLRAQETQTQSMATPAAIKTVASNTPLKHA
jgi:TM2 domain-containing membrane protein YozV